MSIQNLILGSLVSSGADRLLNPNKVKQNQFNILTGGGITGEGDEETKTGPTTIGGIAKQGIMSLLAQAFLGPVFGPLALTLGQNFAAKRREQGLGFMPFGGDESLGPSGIVSGKVQTLDGKIVDAGSDEAIADMNERDREFQETGDYDVYSGTTVTTGPDYGPVTSGTVFDAEDDGGGDDSGGSTGSMDASDFSDDSPGTPFRYGGLASLYR